MPQVLTDSRKQALWPDDRRLPKWPTLLALIGTVLIHLSVILVLPAQLMPIPDPAKERARPTEYEISLVDPEQLRYVEANPAVPQNEPDRTDQYSYRSQQAADESPLSDPLNQPRVEGETDSQKIIQGTLEQSPPVEPGIYAPEAQPGEGERDAGGESGDPSEPAPDSEPSAPSLAQPLPAPDFLQQEVVSEAGPGSQIEPVGEASEVTEAPDPNAPIDLYRPPADQPVEASMADGGRGASQRQAEPRPRPRLAPELVTGPLMRSQGSASRRGTLAIDATFSEFGEYEQQFYAAVQTGWYQEIEFFQPIDTASQVHVRFTLHADGRVSDVHTVHSTASEIATFISENAISKRSPFRPWTREMVQVFGQERTLNVRFHYR